MDETTARMLSGLTGAFYAQVAPSFSATRQGAWPGWRRVLSEVGLSGHGAHGCLRVLDLACGNLRFERFLAERLGGTALDVRAVDSCDELARAAIPEQVRLAYAHLDIAEALLEGDDLASRIGPRDRDLAVCFAFLHHLPLLAQRERALDALVRSVRPGGFVAVSLWQLSRSERLAAQARATTAAALPELGSPALGPGDYLLGWQGRRDVLRFCHDFSEHEVDALAAAVAPRAREVARLSADGATGDLNRYLVLRVSD